MLPEISWTRLVLLCDSKRYVMMATLAGVMIAVVLGLLGLAVSVFQAWVGYQQWKYPVTV